MTDKYSGQVVFTKMQTRQKDVWSENTRSGTYSVKQKRRLRNIAISLAAVFCIGMGSVHVFTNREQAAQVMTHITTDFEYDETLGRLQFVSNMLPESTMVFLENEFEPISVFSPSDSIVIHAWSIEEPWIEYESSDNVTVCQNGDVMTVVKNRENEYTVRVMHDDGYESVYSGLKDVTVSAYDQVFAGDSLGSSKGVAAFELRKDGLSIKPIFQMMDGE